jgi:MFS family permease
VPPAAPQAAPPAPPLPDQAAITWPTGVLAANTFAGLNALSWQIALGAPVILYAKSQGASATMLGLVAALAPLLVIFQIPAAHWMPRLGYKRLILAGWGSRTAVVFAMAAVPIIAFVSPTTRLWLIVLCLTLFNFFRGIASGAWMPWICEWIPEKLRGRFLSRDQVASQIGALVAMLASAALLSGASTSWQFSMVFLLSAISATISLFFVRRIPDVMAPERRQQSGARVPWLHMLAWAPFRSLLVFNLLWVVAASGLTVFTVSLMRGIGGYSESQILLFAALGIIGAMVSVPTIGRLVDSGRNRAVLAGCVVAVAAASVGWWAVSTGMLGQGVIVIAILHFVLGATAVNFWIANQRFAMATFPLMGRNHFFAMFSVITNVTAGLVPIAWGALIDAIGDYTLQTGGIVWNRYGFYFAAVAAVAILGLISARLLPEPTSPPTACPVPATP